MRTLKRGWGSSIKEPRQVCNPLIGMLYLENPVPPLGRFLCCCCHRIKRGGGGRGTGFKFSNCHKLFGRMRPRPALFSG